MIGNAAAALPASFVVVACSIDFSGRFPWMTAPPCRNDGGIP